VVGPFGYLGLNRGGFEFSFGTDDKPAGGQMYEKRVVEIRAGRS